MDRFMEMQAFVAVVNPPCALSNHRMRAISAALMRAAIARARASAPVFDPSAAMLSNTSGMSSVWKARRRPPSAGERQSNW